MKKLFLIFLFPAFCANAGTTAVDCSTADNVNNAIANAPENTVLVCAPGDVSWTKTIIIPDSKALTLKGGGTVSFLGMGGVGPANFQFGSITNPTIVTYNSGTGARGPLLIVYAKRGSVGSPQTTLRTRITGFQFNPGSAPGISTESPAVNAGEIVFTGNDNRYDGRIIWDNCFWNNMKGIVTQNGAVVGVCSRLLVKSSNWLHPMQPQWNGGQYGDKSWSDPIDWGCYTDTPAGRNFGLVIEDCQFDIPAGTNALHDAVGGARMCDRHNQVQGGTGFQSHGTESGSFSGYRGVCAMDVYDNDIYIGGGGNINARSGVVMAHGNIWHGGSTGVSLRQYRDRWGFNPWLEGDGDNPWDQNADGPFPHTGGNGSFFASSYTATGGNTTPSTGGFVTVSGSPFTTNQLAGYTIVKTDNISIFNNGDGPIRVSYGIIQSNTASQINYACGFTSAPQDLMFANGDHFKIMRVDSSFDQPGMHGGFAEGSNTLPITRGSVSSPNIPASGPRQVITPCYAWNQVAGFGPFTDKTIRSGIHYKSLNTVPPNVGPDGPDTYQVAPTNPGATLTYPHPILPWATANPTVTTTGNTTFSVGTANNCTTHVNCISITTTGFTGTPTITKTGALPGVVSFTDNGNGTAIISGPASGATPGDYPLTITAHVTSPNQTATLDVPLKLVNPNSLPAVNITSPTDGSTFRTIDTIQLKVTTSDSDGFVQKVDYYRGGSTLIGTSLLPPDFAVPWSGMAAGSYSITAKATDDKAGVSGASTPINITVAASTPTPAPTPPTQILVKP